MPYLHLKEDGLSMWYITNLPGDGSGRYLDRSKPTLLLLHGTVLGAAGMIEQIGDPRLSQRFNIIAPDLRSSGESRNEPEAARDGWTDAADVIKLLDHLQIPAVHVFAVSCISVHAAQRMPILWPSRCLSVTMVSVPVDEDEQWMSDSLAEVFGMFVTATSIEGMDEAVQELFPYGFGHMERWLSDAKKDEFALYLEIQYNATRSSRMHDLAMSIAQRVLLTSVELEQIKCPVLIINGDDSFVSSPDSAIKLSQGLVNVPGGAKLHIVEGAPDLMHFTPQFGKLINGFFLDFLDGIPSRPPTSPPAGDSMRSALNKLARLKRDPAIAHRDPRRSVSFSCVPQAMFDERREAFARCETMSKGAWTPIGPNGELPRKYSERYIPQSWFSPTQISGTSSNLFAVGVDIGVEVTVRDEH